MTRYASSHSSAISSQSGSRSSRTPSQPRCPTYGGRKNVSGSEAISSCCAPGGAAHHRCAKLDVVVPGLPQRHEGLLSADEPGRRAVAEPLGDLGKRHADRAQPLVVHDAYSAPVLIATERLVLRRFRASDAVTLSAYRSDPAVARYQSWDAPYPLDRAEATVASLATGDPDEPGLVPVRGRAHRRQDPHRRRRRQPPREPPAGRDRFHPGHGVPRPGVRVRGRPRHPRTPVPHPRAAQGLGGVRRPQHRVGAAARTGRLHPRGAAPRSRPGSRTSGPTT